jgi:hypothetical protein
MRVVHIALIKVSGINGALRYWFGLLCATRLPHELLLHLLITLLVWLAHEAPGNFAFRAHIWPPLQILPEETPEQFRVYVIYHGLHAHVLSSLHVSKESFI